MNIHLPKTAKDIKGPVAIAELKRAHVIIVALAVSFAVMLAVVSTLEVQLNAPLGLVAIVLLLIMATISLATVLTLRER